MPERYCLIDYAALPGARSLMRDGLLARMGPMCAARRSLEFQRRRRYRQFTCRRPTAGFRSSCSQILRNLLTRVAQIQIFRLFFCQNSRPALLDKLHPVRLLEISQLIKVPLQLLNSRGAFLERSICSLGGSNSSLDGPIVVRSQCLQDLKSVPFVV